MALNEENSDRRSHFTKRGPFLGDKSFQGRESTHSRRSTTVIPVFSPGTGMRLTSPARSFPNLHRTQWKNLSYNRPSFTWGMRYIPRAFGLLDGFLRSSWHGLTRRIISSSPLRLTTPISPYQKQPFRWWKGIQCRASKQIQLTASDFDAAARDEPFRWLLKESIHLQITCLVIFEEDRYAKSIGANRFVIHLHGRKGYSKFNLCPTMPFAFLFSAISLLLSAFVYKQ